jgi:hypothetical protein
MWPFKRKDKAKPVSGPELKSSSLLVGGHRVTTGGGRYSVAIQLQGETPQQLWRILLGLMSQACECKTLSQGDAWPEMVSSHHGKISIVDNHPQEP